MIEATQLEKIRVGLLADLLEWKYEYPNQLAIDLDNRTMYRSTKAGQGADVLEVFDLENFAADLESGDGTVVVGEADAFRFNDDFTVTDLGSGRGRIDFNLAAAHAWTAVQSVTRSGATDPAWRTFVGVEAQPRLNVAAGGTLAWSDGTAVADLTLARGAAGKATLTGALRVAGTNTAPYLELSNGENVGVSAANEGRIRYNAAQQRWEQSVNGAAYEALGGVSLGGVVGGGTAGRVLYLAAGPVLADSANLTFNPASALTLGVDLMPLTTGEHDLGTNLVRWGTYYGNSILGTDLTLTGDWPYIAIIGDNEGFGGISIKTGAFLDPQWEIDGYGTMSWGDGSAPASVSLGYVSSGLLGVTGSLKATGKFFGSVGSFAAPSYAFTAEPTFGWTLSTVGTYKDDSFYAAVNGAATVEIYSAGGFSSVTSLGTGFGGFYIASDASYSSDVARFKADTVTGDALLASVTGILDIGTYASKNLLFFTNNTDRWFINSSGHFLAYADNTYDVGASGANRPRNVYVGTSAVFGSYSVGLAADPYYGTMLSVIWGGNRKVSVGSDGTFTTIDVFGETAEIWFSDTDSFTKFGLVQFDASGDYFNFGASGDVYITAGSGKVIYFGNIGDRWLINAGGHFIASTDNTYDHGDSTHRARNVYAGTQFFGPNGSQSAPSFASVTQPTYGMYFETGSVDFAVAGARTFSVQGSAKCYVIGSGATLVLFNDTTPTLSFGASEDVKLTRDGAAVLAQKNGTTAQAFRVYGTTTGAVYLALTNDGTNGYVYANGASSSLYLGASGSQQWRVSSSGHFLAVTDNTYDVGASGATRPRSIYWGTQLLGPDGTSSAPSFARASQTGFGLYFGAAQTINLAYSAGSRLSICPDPEAFTMGSAWVLQWTNGNLSTDTADVKLVRVGAAILGLRNSTIAQSFRVYGSTTGPKLVELNNDGTHSYVTGVGTGGSLYFGTVGVNRARFDENGHFLANVTATYDLGASATTWRHLYLSGNITYGGTLLVADGSNSAPSIARSAQTTTGLWFGSDIVATSAANAGSVIFTANNGFGAVSLRNNTGGTAVSSWYESTDIVLASVGGTRKIVLTSVGNVVEIKNSTTAQELRIYGTTTGPKYLALGHDGTDATISTPSGAGGFVLSPINDIISVRRAAASNEYFDLYDTYVSGSNYSRLRVGGSSANLLLSQNAGAGASRDLQIGTDTGVAAKLVILTQGSIRWNFVASGHLEPQVDATYNIGSSTANVNILYVNTIIGASHHRIGTNPSASGDLRLRNNGSISWRNSTNAGDVIGLIYNNSNVLVLADGNLDLQIVNHASGKLGFFTTSPVAQQVGGVTLTNNVTSGGTTNQLDDFTSLTVYATDAAAIRNNIYQLGRKLKLVTDLLRTYGLAKNADA